ncbi:hypothetical protein Ga0074812_102134 [Parafrankia irregularis]|uniref:Uncharacterized protein n=1 Tax=Parafrankia irregularis TaxID=795642 RepID=A0A0S4QG22_9ACTN|nr:hypothetical protein [Parafrankia sp. CH37]CUU54130.1 hypothetical protein Ga0074812_102134 [Parafrankia irregularis]
MQRHTTGRRGKPPRFSIAVPDSWFVLDTQAARSTAAIARMATERARGHPLLAGREPTVARILHDAATRAESAGAAYCAVMIEDVRGIGLSASVMVCVLPTDRHIPDLPRQERPASDDAEAGERRRWRRVGAVDLPAVGLATRTVRLEPQRSTDGAEISHLVMRTTVPVPGHDRIAVIACASPNTALAVALHDLFDAVTATFTFVHEMP